MAKSPVMNSWRIASTALRKVCSPPRKEVLSGSWEVRGLLARSYVRRAEGDLRISNAKPRRWNALRIFLEDVEIQLGDKPGGQWMQGGFIWMADFGSFEVASS